LFVGRRKLRVYLPLFEIDIVVIGLKIIAEKEGRVV